MIDQQYNADLQPQLSAFYRKILFILLATLLFISILGAALWYIGKGRMEPQIAFDPAKQFIPQGAASLPVNDALNAFNLPQPLPFFDERNVVQSLDLSLTASNTPVVITRIYLSYRVFGQDMATIHDAYARYFIDRGWKKVASASETVRSLYFRAPDSQHLIEISFSEIADQKVASISQRAVVVALSLFPRQISNPSYQPQ